MKKSILFIFYMTMNATALAGGIGSGGGGTTNPHPVDPSAVVAATKNFGGKLALTWLYSQHEIFERLSLAEQTSSPFLKLFRPNAHILDIVKNATIELRMNEPCYDSLGNPKDGSIYARGGASVCISPFSMAPKLNERNVNEETIALVLHELSHLVGTTEDEAVAIQQAAIGSFSKLDMGEVAAYIDLLSTDRTTNFPGKLAQVIETADCLSQDACQGPSFWLRDSLVDIYEKMTERFTNIRFEDFSLARLFMPNTVIAEMVGTYLCSIDPSSDQSNRNTCNGNLDKAFQGDSTVTARQFFTREGSVDPSMALGPEFDDVHLSRPRSRQSALADVAAIGTYLRSIESQVDQLRIFYFNVLAD